MQTEFSQNQDLQTKNSKSSGVITNSSAARSIPTHPRRIILANSIKSARQAKGFKQAVLARKIGCNQATLSRIESAATSIDVDLLIEICNQLDISVPSLLGSMQ